MLTPLIKAADTGCQTKTDTANVSVLAGSMGRRWTWGSRMKESLLASRSALCTLLQSDSLQGGMKDSIKHCKADNTPWYHTCNVRNEVP